MEPASISESSYPDIELSDIQQRAEGEAKEAIGEARERLASVRGTPEQ